MGLLKTNADPELMKKYLDETLILPVIEKHRSLLSRPYATIKRFEAEHVKLLSAQSYLVKYTVTIVADGGDTFTIVLRGNRISPEAAAMWQHLFSYSSKDNLRAVPTPLEYFHADNFMLYEELSGKTLRDYDDKLEYLKRVTPDIAARLAWIHGLPSIASVGTHTPEEEALYWNSVTSKITTYLPQKPQWLDEALAEIHADCVKHFSKQMMTLCHNDFQASNIIFNEQSGNIGIIDFGNSTIFTPTLDVATYLVHLAVMTTKHLELDAIKDLQRQFIKSYLSLAPATISTQVRNELSLYIARVAADIVATTAVALTHTQNPYRILIPNLLLPVIEKYGKDGSNTSSDIEQLLISLKR